MAPSRRRVVVSEEKKKGSIPGHPLATHRHGQPHVPGGGQPSGCNKRSGDSDRTQAREALSPSTVLTPRS